MTAVGYRARSELRRHAVATVVLAVMAGAIGGVVLASAAAARRTSTAMERFVEWNKPGTLFLEFEPGSIDEDAVTALPQVVATASGSYVLMVPARPDGCHPVDGCGDGDPYHGADFPFLAANVAYRDSGATIFPPYAIHDLPGGVKIAFVGMTLEGTPEIVSPTGIVSVRFNDEADSVNALVPFIPAPPLGWCRSPSVCPHSSRR